MITKEERTLKVEKSLEKEKTEANWAMETV
jgi:hypothetical protein